MNYVPDYQQFFGPALEVTYQAKGALTRKEIADKSADILGLNEAAMQESIPSGFPRYLSNSGWACTYLKQAGCLETPKRNAWVITEQGRALHKELGNEVSSETLLRFPSFVEFINKKGTRKTGQVLGDKPPVTEMNPDEMLETGYSELRAKLSNDLMDSILEIQGREGDTFFEKLVTDLLEKIGYGKGRVTTASNDGGIDGIITTDALGFDPIYVQAKRYALENSIGRPLVQSFAGALGATKRGAIITTSTFSSGAVEFAKTYPHADIILIDGDKLTDLMIDYDLGVATDSTIKLKRLDTDYFSQDT